MGSREIKREKLEMEEGSKGVKREKGSTKNELN